MLQRLCGVGLILGTLFFAASLTPSLVPRTVQIQGLLAGLCMALGYGIGVLLRRLWNYLELPQAPASLRARTNAVLLVLCAAVVIVFLWLAAPWQNAVRAGMDLPPLPRSYPFKLFVLALVTFVVLLFLGRLIGYAMRRTAALLRRFIPRRFANALGVTIAAVLLWMLARDLLFSRVMQGLDASYRELDELIEPERPQPDDPGRTGSAASLVEWEELGRAGREFVASGPSVADITALTGRDARQPLRVYVGLRSGEDATGRAELALAELKRQGGFDRKVLVIITPTGTGWVDPSAMDALEYMHDGDVASVAMQYSYLSSPLSLLVHPEVGATSARALFDAVYGYWTSLPRDQRPRLYLHGLSLGAMNSERSTQVFQMFEDPISGALWSGPPFQSTLWRSLTESRNPGSPKWLPQVGDGRLVRFMNQQGTTLPADAPWGVMRLMYLQYADDAIVFFDVRDAWRRPEWLDPPRGPGVSPTLRWYPVVTMMQVALDMMLAMDTPPGHGHVYAPEHYTQAWAEVTGITHWSAEDLEKLKRHLAEVARKNMEGEGGKEDAYDNRGG